jgi:hypothetical protein
MADQEIANLSRIFKMNVGIDVGYHNVDPSPPCSRSRVSTAISITGDDSRCVAIFLVFVEQQESRTSSPDLNTDDFATAHARLSRIASDQLETRKRRLASLDSEDASDPYISSPCLLCLDTFGKLPWREDFARSDPTHARCQYCNALKKTCSPIRYPP